MEDVSQLPEHVARNRAYWDEQAADYVQSGERNWAAEEPSWGIWGIPESVAHLLPESLADRDAIELGCGTAYVSAWLARRAVSSCFGELSMPTTRAPRRASQAET